MRIPRGSAAALLAMAVAAGLVGCGSPSGPGGVSDGGDQAGVEEQQQAVVDAAADEAEVPGWDAAEPAPEPEPTASPVPQYLDPAYRDEVTLQCVQTNWFGSDRGDAVGAVSMCQNDMMLEQAKYYYVDVIGPPQTYTQMELERRFGEYMDWDALLTDEEIAQLMDDAEALQDCEGRRSYQSDYTGPCEP